MLSCFSSPIKITQEFGNDFYINSVGKIISINQYNNLVEIMKKQYRLYYKSMGIDGHDGLDVVPEDTKDWRIFSVWGGVVIEKKFHNIYGNRISIWNKYNYTIEYHNHLGIFCPSVNVGDVIKKGTYLGMMGQTGKVFGAHNHFAIAKSDNKGNRINRQNGFFGYVSPIPFLEN